jgi:hypothetical protein
MIDWLYAIEDGVRVGVSGISAVWVSFIASLITFSIFYIKDDGCNPLSLLW